MKKKSGEEKKNVIQNPKDSAGAKVPAKVFDKRNFYTIKDSGFVFLLALILPLAIGLFVAYLTMFIVTRLGVAFPEGSNIIRELFNNYYWFSIPFMLLTQVVFICLWLIYHKGARISYKATPFSFKKANPWTVLLSIVTGIISVLGFLWLIEGCFGKLFTIWGFENSSMGLPLDSVGWLFANFIILGIVPAICEELLFRGIIFTGLRKSFGVLASVLIDGLLFALIHQSLLQFIYPFILGCILCVVLEKTGNILYTILIHMFNNFTTIFLTYLTNIGVMTGTFILTWWGILCAILIAVVTCVIFWLIYRFYLCKQEKFVRDNTEEIVAQEKKSGSDNAFMVGKFPLSMIVGIIFAIIMIVINLVG